MDGCCVFLFRLGENMIDMILKRKNIGLDGIIERGIWIFYRMVVKF